MSRLTVHAPKVQISKNFLAVLTGGPAHIHARRGHFRQPLFFPNEAQCYVISPGVDLIHKDENLLYSF